MLTNCWGRWSWVPGAVLGMACASIWAFLPSLPIHPPTIPYASYQPGQNHPLEPPGASVPGWGAQVGKDRIPGVKGVPGQCWAPLLFFFLARTQQKSTLLCICCSHFSKGFICLHLHKKYHTPILMRPIWQYRPPLTGFCSVESCTGQGCDN